MTALAPAPPPTINVCVIHTTNRLHNFVVKPTLTVGQLKALLAARVDEDPETFRFRFTSRVLEDELTLEQYGITNGATIHNMGKLPGGAGILPIGSTRTPAPSPTPQPKPKKPGL
jgi:hypothetical protein